MNNNYNKIKSSSEIAEGIEELVEKLDGCCYEDASSAIGKFLAVVANYIVLRTNKNVLAMEYRLSIDFLKSFLLIGNTLGLSIMNYDNLIYPYAFDHVREVSADMLPKIQEYAKSMLADREYLDNCYGYGCYEYVEQIANGKIPDGVIVINNESA